MLRELTQPGNIPSNLKNGSKFPDELVVHSLNSEARYISSVSVWGILRGMESFSQAIFLQTFLSSDI